MSAPTLDEISTWTPQERAEVARHLDALLERPILRGRTRGRRILTLFVTLFGAIILLPWIIYLANTLPSTESVRAWSAAWIGFDVFLALVLGIAGWLLWHRRQLAIVALTSAATLILTDAWFDVFMSWHSSEEHLALLNALVVEIPASILLITAVVTTSKVTGTITNRLRGVVRDIRVWNQPFVFVPPGIDPHWHLNYTHTHDHDHEDPPE